jgi:hypothetical protein
MKNDDGAASNLQDGTDVHHAPAASIMRTHYAEEIILDDVMRTRLHSTFQQGILLRKNSKNRTIG